MATNEVTLDDVISGQALTIEMGESLWDAWQMMFVSGLHHLAVIDADREFMGIISDRMILTSAPVTAESLGSRSVGELVRSRPVASLTCDDSPVAAARLMSEHSLDAVAVLDSRSRLVGIVTETDLVRWLLAA